jgi:ferrochelatase
MTGLLLINLGTPESTSKKDVKKYLEEFLMDERVIDIDYWKRWLLIKGIVLNTRPAKSAEAYKKVWTEEGSPLMVHTVNLAKKVQEKLGDSIYVTFAMRYGNPSIVDTIKELKGNGVTKLVVLPLYPQHAMSSTETVVEKVREEVKKQNASWEMKIIPAFYNDSRYIQNLADSIESEINVDHYDKIVFSYHGIPERQVLKTDTTESHCKIDGSCCNTPSPAHKTCYRHQAFETTKLVEQQLNWDASKTINTFQSRLGRAEWLKPYNALTLAELPAQGVKKIAVVMPAFVADCLETLEEMRMEGQEIFLGAGGERFDVVSCLNDDDNWAQTIAEWTKEAF